MVDAALAGKRIAIISDNNSLARAVELELSHCLQLGIVRCVLNPLVSVRYKIDGDGLDLILVVVSLPSSEPVVMLAQAALTQQIGHVPLLIVSDRPFDPDVDTQSFHLGFPVNANELRDKVKEILKG